MMDALASLFSYEQSLILLIAFESSLLVCRIQRQLDQWDYGFLPERLHERGRRACAYRYFEVSANRCQESLPMLRRTFLQVNLQVLPLPQRFCMLSPDMCRVTLDTVQTSEAGVRGYTKNYESLTCRSDMAMIFNIRVELVVKPVTIKHYPCPPIREIHRIEQHAGSTSGNFWCILFLNPTCGT